LQHGTDKIRESRANEKSKLSVSKLKKEKLDQMRATLLDELTLLCSISMEDTVNAKRMLDALGMSLSGKSWKKQEAIDKAPKPSLEESLEHFPGPFAAFMEKKHATKLMLFYQFTLDYKKSTIERMGIETILQMAQDEFDKYLDPCSPDYIAINPSYAKAVKDTLFTNDSLDELKLKNCFDQVNIELAKLLELKYMDDFYAGIDFQTISKHPSGRCWRVLKMCKLSREICRRLEKEIAIRMNEFVKADRFKDMYGGSASFNKNTKDISIEFQEKLLDTMGRIEMSAIVIKALYEKVAKKSSMLTSTAMTPSDDASRAAKNKKARRNSLSKQFAEL
jgi:hypothetical protein